MYGYNTSRHSNEDNGYLARFRNRPRAQPAERDRSTLLGYGNRRYRRYNYHSGPRRWKPWWYRYQPNRVVTPSSRPADPVPPPREDLVRIPNVKNVDLMVQQNASKHRTDEYECTRAPEDRADGKPAECVVRRGESMRIRVTFDRPYQKYDHNMKIKFAFGPDPVEVEGTEVEMVLNEHDDPAATGNKWGAKLAHVQGNDIIVDIHIACNCIIGEWNLSIVTTLEDQDYVKDYSYIHGEDINILFNPWCKDDSTFLPSDPMRKEYVLEDSGTLYQGEKHTIIPKAWTFGQFEYGILDCTLRLITTAVKETQYRILADPIRVARILAHKVNEQVLIGNWSGKYEDGTAPWMWGGSTKILQEHIRTQKKVKYGQCWVFSGILTTVCRAIGLPCRSITNYGSAHDTDDSNTIDKYFYWRGNTLHLDKQKTRDSIWNFHVWNEVFFMRPDLDSQGSYDGWQVIDATPQELSDGIYTCGPASLVAIKHGLCDRRFDTGFVFSEVNSDEIHWEMRGSKYHVFKRMKKKIGNNISTKQAAGRGRDDVTSLYKYKEGSPEERQAVNNAIKTAENPRPGVLEFNDIKWVKFKLLHSNDVMIGEDLLIEVRATNNGHHERTIVETELTVEAELYTGESDPLGQPITDVTTGSFKLAPGRSVTCMQYTLKARDYLPKLVENAYINITMSATVAGNQDEKEELHVKEHKFVFKKPELIIEVTVTCMQYTLKARDYLPKLVENAYINITMSATVAENENEKEELHVKEHKFVFKKPELMIEMPNVVRFRRPVSAILSFVNPLPYPLTQVVLSEDSVAFSIRKGSDQMRLPDIPAKRDFKIAIDALPTRIKRSAAITFTISSRELYDIRGSKQVEISKF